MTTILVLRVLDEDVRASSTDSIAANVTVTEQHQHFDDPSLLNERRQVMAWELRMSSKTDVSHALVLHQRRSSRLLLRPQRRPSGMSLASHPSPFSKNYLRLAVCECHPFR